MKDENFGPTRWHECVSAVISSCLEETECTKQDLCEAAASMPFLIDVVGALRDVDEVKVGKKCGQAIISDGNDLFITEFLKRNGMEDYFTHGIETNTGIWETIDCHGKNDIFAGNTNAFETRFGGEKLRIVYQSAKFGGHSCLSCPPNLCKSQALRDILDRSDQHTLGDGEQAITVRPRIVYIGDGSNDACPALHVLRDNDILLARGGRRRRDPNSLSGPTPDEDSSEGHGCHNFHPDKHVDEFESHISGAFPILSTLRKSKLRDGLVPKCTVCVWRSGRQLRSLVRQILDDTIS
eukprot:CCRYP_005055-RA/>CCRYP_005055-RA protein AED:0.00 eAED:0.00 QI:288/-1/1/1/-1/1/1/137/294